MAVFWDSHDPTVPSWSSQYLSIIFYHNEEQRALAIASKQEAEVRLGGKIVTEIVPYSTFYLAEDYHQKHYLRQEPDLLREFRAIYPATEDFIASTAVARVNGYAAGYGTRENLEAELGSLGLSEAGRAILLKIAGRGLVSGCAVP